MAVRVETESPKALLKRIRDSIGEGTIKTWDVDKDGDLTHSPEQWRYKAWFRPKVSEGELAFYILAPRGKKLSTLIYGLYHGRLIEMLLNHFDSNFARASATAYPEGGDTINPPE